LSADTSPKQRLLDQLRAQVDADLEALVRRQRAEQTGATHTESRAEHAKDTRATEQSYLARGLAERVESLSRTAEVLDQLGLRLFSGDDPIAPTALVRLETLDEAAPDATWFIIPAAGGFDLQNGAERVRTVTPVSPVGRALLGLSAGEEVTIRTPAGERRFEVRSVE